MVDHTVLHCCQCGMKTIVALTKRLDTSLLFEEDNDPPSLLSGSKYYDFSELLNVIDDLKEEIQILKKENEMYRNIVESDKEKKKLHDWMTHRMTYVEEVINQLRKTKDDE